MNETFYRNVDGKLIFRAIQSVGSKNAVSFAEAYGWNKNGFPTKHPDSLGSETIWVALEQTQKHTTA